jgi:hypothetical protein
MLHDILETYGWLIAVATIIVTAGATLRARAAKAEAERAERAEYNLRTRDDRA